MKRGNHRVYEGNVAQSAIQTFETTIDSSRVQSGPSIDFIKADTRGAESRRIRAMRQTFARSELTVPLREFWPAGPAAAATSSTEYPDTLRKPSHHFTLIATSDDAVTAVSASDLFAPYAGGDDFTNLLCEREATACISERTATETTTPVPTRRMRRTRTGTWSPD